MRRILFTILLTTLFSINSYSQFTTDEIIYTKSINIKNSNSWAVGGGFSNFIMHGDLRSIGTGNLGNYWNFGGYLLIDKMFNPLLGMELKLNYSKISGGAQYLSNIYEVLYVPNALITNDLHFKGQAYGAELNLIFSFTNLYETKAEKWNFVGYMGIGYHQYDSALYDGANNLLVDFGKNPRRNSVNQASSIFLTAQLGLKYKLNKKVDLELRPSIYFNYEDHLDATISNKQDWETFFVTHLGVVIKLGKQKIFTLWGEDNTRRADQFKIVDTDKDGVIDQIDKIEPNTPLGVMVYPNGVSIDSDGDGVPDYLDKCKFEVGRKDNDGCPFIGDRDKDGVADRDDKCIDVPGLERYNGCPDRESLRLKEIITILKYSKNIYFNTDSNEIKNAYYYSMLDDVAEIMLKNKDVKFSVTGYTDNIGKSSYNLKLSIRRAKQARKFLIQRGVEPDRIIAYGFGEENSKYSNKTEEGRRLNRRVEIKSIGAYHKKTKLLMDRD